MISDDTTVQSRSDHSFFCGIGNKCQETEDGEEPPKKKVKTTFLESNVPTKEDGDEEVDEEEGESETVSMTCWWSNHWDIVKELNVVVHVFKFEQCKLTPF